MRLHYLQHVPYETPGAILLWAAARGVEVTGTLPAEGAPFPSVDAFDWLVVMGGPMNVYEDEAHPWLAAEKRLIEDAVAAGRVVLGICLGAQLLADVLGGTVSRNEAPEIGWFPVALTAAGIAHPAFAGLPEEFTALHWHGDTFSLPPGAVHVAESAATPNQAFAYGERAFGLQFHLECTPGGLAQLVAAAGAELVEGPWIQPAETILGRPSEIRRSERLMASLLDGIAAATG